MTILLSWLPLYNKKEALMSLLLRLLLKNERSRTLS
jgi:hypothetical protein